MRSCRRSSISYQTAANCEPCGRSCRHTRTCRAIFALGEARVDGRRSWFGKDRSLVQSPNGRGGHSSQTASTTEAGGLGGFDAGKRLQERKPLCERASQASSMSLPTGVIGQTARLCTLRLRTVDDRHRRATARRQSFQLLPGRWALECTFAWLGRCRSTVLPPPNSPAAICGS